MRLCTTGSRPSHARGDHRDRTPGQPRRLGGGRRRRARPAGGRRPGDLRGRTGRAAGRARRRTPARRRDRRGPAAPAHGRGRRHARTDRARRAAPPCWKRSRVADSSSPTTSCGTPAIPRPSSARAARGVTTQVTELSYLHSRDITYAVFCQGPYDESARYRDFMGWDMPWYSAQRPSTRCSSGARSG